MRITQAKLRSTPPHQHGTTTPRVQENPMPLSRRHVLLAGATSLIPLGLPLGRASADDTGRSAINVRELGARGDGSTNDTAAIDRALRNYDIVYFPAGRYVHDNRLVMRPGQSIRGDGEGSVILSAIQFSDNCTAMWLRVESSDCSVFGKVVDNALLTGIHFVGGNHLAALSFDDCRVTNSRFDWCRFSDNPIGNGVKIVEKGYDACHYENLVFTGCEFYNNARMNFEVIQRDGNQPATMGYKGIDLVDCVATGNPNVPDQINVSYDSQFLSDGSRRSSGHSLVKGTKITGGAVGLELAGSVHMTVQGSTITGVRKQPIVICQVSIDEDAGHQILETTTDGQGSVDVSGANNLVRGCTMSSQDKPIRLVDARHSVVDGCRISTNFPTAMTLERSHDNEIKGCTFNGGQYNSILVIYSGTNDNSVHDCTFADSGITIDVRDGNRVSQWNNSRR